MAYRTTVGVSAAVFAVVSANGFVSQALYARFAPGGRDLCSFRTAPWALLGEKILTAWLGLHFVIRQSLFAVFLAPWHGDLQLLAFSARGQLLV